MLLTSEACRAAGIALTRQPALKDTMFLPCCNKVFTFISVPQIDELTAKDVEFTQSITIDQFK